MDAEFEGVAPLLEAVAVIVVRNCQGCRGTGYLVNGRPPWDGRDPGVEDVPNDAQRHEDCDGSGREAVEMPLSEFVQLAAQVNVRTTQPPSLSEMRRG